MKRNIISKLSHAQTRLGLQFPSNLFDFISKLKNPDVLFGEEEWFFWTLIDKKDNDDDNFVVTCSTNFEENWKIKGLVFAVSGTGDYLVLLPDETNKLSEKIYVIDHERAEIKVFAESLEELLEDGPDDYFSTREFYLKLGDNDQVIRWTERERKIHDTPKDNFDAEVNDDDHKLRPYLDDLMDDDDKLRSYLDDLIDDESTEQTTVIIQGLEKLAESSEDHKVWALNKLSDIYLRGFGPVPQNLTRALEYNQQAMDLNSHKAYANRAACYFSGLGVERDLNKALEFVTRANELSKSSRLASIVSKKEGGGFYDSLVAMVKKEIKKERK